MLAMKLQRQTVDLRWPGGRHLVLVGPEGPNGTIKLKAPGGRLIRSAPVPPAGERVRFHLGPLSFGLYISRRDDCRVGFEIPPECEVERRGWGGKRAS